MTKKIIYSLLFVLWLLIMLGGRMLWLDRSPQSVGFDEASLGYNAYSLLLTGKDEYGTPYPLSLRSFNDFKPALYSYLTIPFIYLFGLSDATIRMPSAFLGTLAILFTFLIFRKIGKPRPIFVDLILISVISFFPWRIHFSRVAFEANISMAFFTGLIWCLINFGNDIKYKAGALAFAGLAIYSYHSSRLAVPVLFFLYFLDPINLEIRQLIKRPFFYIKILWPVLIVALLYVPLLLEANAGLLLTRLSQTNLFSHYYPFTPGEIILTENPWLNPIGNPLYYLAGLISGHFMSYISPKNLALLIYPGVIKSAQAIGGTGMLGFAGGILFSVGLAVNFRKFFNDAKFKILFYWVISGIIPAAITWEWFYPLRSLNIYPALDIVAGLGILTVFGYLYKIKEKIFKYALALVMMGVISGTSLYNLLNEYGFGAWEISGEFQPGGFKQGIPLLLDLKDNYKTIYLDSNQAQSYALFWYYMKYPPEKVQALAAKRNTPGHQGPPTIDFDNFKFKKFHWPDDKKLDNFLYWTNSEVKEQEINSTKNAKLYKIYGPTGEWIASIVTKE